MSGLADSTNLEWASAFVQELVACGVQTFCVSPGSRSTPLALAIARNQDTESVVHVDERASAFFAVGLARATGKPAAWVTTSGTAAANGFPAIIEADRDELPLICLTADRPPELRDVGANQTIDQVKLFGNAVRWFFDLPCPQGMSGSSVARSVGNHAVTRAIHEYGPVHVNLMFREPLAPEQGETAVSTSADKWRPALVLAESMSSMNDEMLSEIAAMCRKSEKGLIVVGKLPSDCEKHVIHELAMRLGWPVLPDIRSHLRLSGGSGALAYYDLALSSARFRDLLEADVTILLGRPVLSKRLHQFLSAKPPQTVLQVDKSARRLDPDDIVTHRIIGDPVAFAGTLTQKIAPREGPVRLQELKRLDTLVGEKIDQMLERETLSEQAIVREITRHIPEDDILFLGNSLPVRHADTYGVSDRGCIQIHANRGASGIDGNIATAAGIAFGAGRAVTAVTGDLTTLHDLNSLRYVRDLPVTLVVINNNGGGIFSFLPVRSQEDAFESHFAAPQDISFKEFATGFGVPYLNPESGEAFTHAYAESLLSETGTLIEIITDRQKTFILHENMLKEVADLL